MIGSELIPDSHGISTICSSYLDTPSRLLIRSSIEARSYKEKLRLRSYGISDENTPVFLELKKKYLGVVYKRREIMSLSEAMAYLDRGNCSRSSQIMREIDYAMQLYCRPQPSVLIAYEREAYFVKGSPQLRITFDTNVRYRAEQPLSQYGDYGKLILPSEKIILEIKTDGAMPVSFSHALDFCEIFPTSFSKCGAAYRDILSENKINNITYKGAIKNVSNL